MTGRKASTVDVLGHVYGVLAGVLSAGAARPAYVRARELVAGIPVEDLPAVAAALAVEVAWRRTTRRDRGELEARVVRMRAAIAEARAARGPVVDVSPAARVIRLDRKARRGR